MTVLHSVVFNTVKSLKDYFDKFTYWIFCPVNGDSTFARKYDDPEVQKRVYLNKEGNLEFMRRAEEKMHNGLRPRVELSSRILLSKRKPIHVRYEVCLLEGEEFRGMIFQIMDHMSKNDAFPLFQFEIRDKKLHARWIDNLAKTRIVPFHKPKIGEWLNLDVYALLSPNSNEGYYRVHFNDKLVWHHEGKTATKYEIKPSVQFGIYGVPGVKVRTQVRKIQWDET